MRGGKGEGWGEKDEEMRGGKGWKGEGWGKMDEEMREGKGMER